MMMKSVKTFWSIAFIFLLIANVSMAQIIPDSLLREFKYRNVGPNLGGRVTAVAGVVSQQGTFYMGATGGGLWKTTDYGVSWNNISDGYFDIIHLSIHRPS